ncbi:MAG TPA: sugar phosphorylase [Verrucomicrobiae bacterium]|nr:sugar phosphorylase [Verrucomicrobiae bacterium]
MNYKILQYLATLYGRDVAVGVVDKLAKLMSAEAAHRTEPGAAYTLSERDALLITYADQLTEPERAPLHTLADFCREHLREAISGIHILPFYPWSSDDGFSVKDFVAVEPTYGTWDDIARFRPGFDLMFDAVFNHMSAQSDWFQSFLNERDAAFRDFFVTVEGEPDLSQVVRPRALPLLTEFQSPLSFKKVWTTFSADQVDLNFKNPDVLLATIKVLLFYVRHGARFIRLDAIAYLWKEIGTTCIHLPQTHTVIQLFRAVLDEVAPEVMLITETNVPHRDNICYFGDGTNEAQLVYNFSLPPLTLHSIRTGDATMLTRWAQSLSLPSARVTWFNFLASHDGIGVNPARGILTDAEITALIEHVTSHGGFISYKSMPDGSQVPYEMNINYLDALSKPAANEPVELAARKFLTAQAIMLSLQGVPGIYFHSLFGSRGDRPAVEQTGIKRRINREKLKCEQLRRELRDATSLRSRVFTGFCELLSKRRAHQAFAPVAPQQILELDPRVFAVLRQSRDGADRVLCLHNVSNQTVEMRPGLGFESGVLSGYETRWLVASK